MLAAPPLPDATGGEDVAPGGIEPLGGGAPRGETSSDDPHSLAATQIGSSSSSPEREPQARLAAADAAMANTDTPPGPRARMPGEAYVDSGRRYKHGSLFHEETVPVQRLKSEIYGGVCGLLEDR